ncbi:Phosphoenolpyruvate carboxykinase (GTP) [Sedimentisphaera salicampi]|nr:phosphoenolpyruvate carboxykinase (GTP) [Sedimentisphaera salicampi]OXU15225.1 Phosphoenolpyruvate carboxykinase (GTP) [Sedimentisphaera salicampi]
MEKPLEYLKGCMKPDQYEKLAALNNSKLNEFIADSVQLCTPDDVHLCDGSKNEYDTTMAAMVEEGLATDLKARENCFHFRSDPSDVARVEGRTYIACENESDAGPTNNWIHPDELKGTMRDLYNGCMKGRTLFVIPFSMGPIGSPISKIGFEITDSGYVVCNMHIMTRVGDEVLETLGQGDFIPCLHSVGKPLAEGESDNGQWPCAPVDKKYISHFTEEQKIWSFGSGYGGNALLGKKCLALRIASVMAKKEGWMAEHMLILRLTNPEGKKFHIAAAFPSACGKTNLAMLESTVEGWKVECVGDDIAWMKMDDNGQLRAINPESGFFGVAPGTNSKTNPMAVKSCEKNSIFTNCVVTDDGDVWWEDGDGECKHGIDWKGREWTPDSGEKGAHPNARFTAPAAQCPTICPDWEDPAGVPIDIFIFGGRRSELVPLVTEAMDWDHGVYMGATAASEKTAAALDSGVAIRRDPFAMLPFCAYHMADYWQHWFDMGDKLGNKAPKIFYVNWFQKNEKGKFIWPGFGENSRVLKWMCERVDGKAGAYDTAIGKMPKKEDLDLDGIDLTDEEMDKILSVDTEGWKKELPIVREFFETMGDKLPDRMVAQVDRLEERLGK